jgi:hypothetical protein
MPASSSRSSHPVQQHQSLARRHPSRRRRQAPAAVSAGTVLPVQSPQFARWFRRLPDPPRRRMRHYHLRPAHRRHPARGSQPHPPLSRASCATCSSRIGKIFDVHVDGDLGAVTRIIFVDRNRQTHDEERIATLHLDLNKSPCRDWRMSIDVDADAFVRSHIARRDNLNDVRTFDLVTNDLQPLDQQSSQMSIWLTNT